MPTSGRIPLSIGMVIRLICSERSLYFRLTLVGVCVGVQGVEWLTFYGKDAQLLCIMACAYQETILQFIHEQHPNLCTHYAFFLAIAVYNSAIDAVKFFLTPALMQAWNSKSSNLLGEAIKMAQHYILEAEKTTVTPSFPGELERSLLFLMLNKRHHGMVRELLKAMGLDPPESDLNDWLSPQISIIEGHDQILELWLENKQGKYDAEELLLLAAECGRTAMVDSLLRAGSNIETKSPDGWTALLQAIANGHEEVVQLLIDHGADINAETYNKGTALFVAALNGDEGMVNLLVSQGAYINIQVRGLGTALIIAVKGGHKKVVQLLIDHGADINIGGSSGNALQTAAANGQEEIVRLLIDRGANVNMWSFSEGSPLQKAAVIAHEAIVRLLIDHGADVNAQDDDQRTALQQAAARGQEAVVRLLINRRPDGSSQHLFDTPLCLAAKGSHKAVVQLLKEHWSNQKRQIGRNTSPR